MTTDSGPDANGNSEMAGTFEVVVEDIDPDSFQAQLYPIGIAAPQIAAPANPAWQFYFTEIKPLNHYQSAGNKSHFPVSFRVRINSPQVTPVLPVVQAAYQLFIYNKKPPSTQGPGQQPDSNQPIYTKHAQGCSGLPRP